MDHYLVYHNREKMGYPVKADPSETSYYRIITKKSVNSLLGKTIWLVEGHGYNPRKYHLRVMFVVDETKNGKDKVNYAFGKTGKSYGDKFIINSHKYQEWFRPFQRRMANFSLGLQKLQRQDIEFFKRLVSKKEEEGKSSPGGLIPPARKREDTVNMNRLTSALEGKEYLAEQRRRLRNSALTHQRLTKDNFRCQHCGIKPALADTTVAEVHHIYPLKDCDGAVNTKIEDLITLCPTCHRIAHKIGKIHDIEILDLKMLRSFYPRLIAKSTMSDGQLHR